MSRWGSLEVKYFFSVGSFFCQKGVIFKLQPEITVPIWVVTMDPLRTWRRYNAELPGSHLPQVPDSDRGTVPSSPRSGPALLRILGPLGHSGDHGDHGLIMYIYVWFLSNPIQLLRRFYEMYSEFMKRLFTIV